MCEYSTLIKCPILTDVNGSPCRGTLAVIATLMMLALVLELFLNLGPSWLSRDLKKTIFKAVLCFSPYTNLKKIAKTVDANAAGQIGCLNGMRYVRLTLFKLVLYIFD